MKSQYMIDKQLKEFKELLKEAGNPHPNSNRYRDIERSFLIRISYEEGFREGMKEAIVVSELMK